MRKIKLTHEKMHRMILGLKYKDGKQVDHINHSGLDNRECNIRICTNRQNCFNRKNIKGCGWHKHIQKWQAYISVNGQKKHLGYFDKEKDAHEAYLKAKEKVLKEIK